MSLRDFVISFFAMVKQSSFACLGQGHTPHVEFSRSQFSLFACESSHEPCARTSENAEAPREVTTHWGAHDESSTAGVAAPQSQASLGQCPCACT